MIVVVPVELVVSVLAKLLVPEMARRPERKNEKIKKSCPRSELWVGVRAVCMLTTGLKTPRIKSDQRDELPEMARRPERKNEKIKKVARGASCVLHAGRHAC